MRDDRFSTTRRGLLGSAAVGGLVLAGCGGGSGGSGSDASTSGASTSGARKQGGTFKFAPVEMSRVTTADPQSISGGYTLARSMFSSLMKRDAQFRIQPLLAEEFEPKGDDQSVWTIRVHDGVEFHDGKTLDVDDVIHTIQRQLDPKSPSQASALMGAIDLKRMQKLDKRTLRLHLKYPNSQLRDAFAPPDTGIVPVGFDPKKPIGTGPYKQVSFTPSQRWVGERDENYWEQGVPYLDRIEMLGFSDADVARVNALISGQVDGLDKVPAAALSRIQGNGKLQVVHSETGSFQLWGMLTSKGAPFEDPRVRLAMKLIPDRKLLLQSIWSNHGALGNDTGVWHEFDPAMDGSLPQHEQDIEQARSLLKAAGKEGLTATLRVARLAPGMLESAQILVQNAKQAGVTIKLDIVADAAQYYSSNAYYTSQMKADSDATETMFAGVSYSFVGTGVYNNTGYDNPQLNKLYKQALAANPAKYQELMHEISRIIWEDGPWIVWGRQDNFDAYSKEFTGATPNAGGRGFNGNFFQDISLV
jgi:peptide/nickel transport system substrate-binding protein